MKILLIEDNAEDARRIVRAVRRDARAEIVLTVADHLEEAERLQHAADLILADLSLPPHKPPETLLWLRRTGRPFAVYTSMTDPEIARQCVSAGALGVVVKGERLESIGFQLQFLLSLHAYRRRFLAELEEIRRGT